MIPKPPSNGTPLPGAVSFEVIREGYQRDLLFMGSDKVTCLDHSFLDDRNLSLSLSLSGVQAIKEKVRSQEPPGNRTQYVEDFIREIEASREGNHEVQRFYDAIQALEQKHYLPHPLGIGLIAVHFYHHDR